MDDQDQTATPTEGTEVEEPTVAPEVGGDEAEEAAEPAEGDEAGSDEAAAE